VSRFNSTTSRFNIAEYDYGSVPTKGQSIRAPVVSLVIPSGTYQTFSQPDQLSWIYSFQADLNTSVTINTYLPQIQSLIVRNF